MRSRDCHFRIASRSMKKAITRRRLMELTAAFAASSAVAHNVHAQAYPNHMHAFEFCPSLPLLAQARWWAIWSCRPWLDDRDAAQSRMGPFGGLRTFRECPLGR